MQQVYVIDIPAFHESEFVKAEDLIFPPMPELIIIKCMYQIDNSAKSEHLLFLRVDNRRIKNYSEPSYFNHKSFKL